MKLYLIFALAAVLVTLASAKNLKPEPSNNENLDKEAEKIAEKYAALEKERKETVDNVNKEFTESENEREAEVLKIEDDITELEKEQKETVEEINANFGDLAKEEEKAFAKIDSQIFANILAKQEKQREFEYTLAILNLPTVRKQIIALDRRYSPAMALKLFSVDKNIRPDGSLKNLTAAYKLKCNGYKKRVCERGIIKLSFSEHANLFNAQIDVTSFRGNIY